MIGRGAGCRYMHGRPSRLLAGALVLTLATVAGGAIGGNDTSSMAIAANKRKVDRSIDLTNLKLGDGKVTTSGPRRGWVYTCQSRFAAAATVTGPWINGKHWDYTAKPTVSGRVSWPSVYSVSRQGSTRRISGNGLPSNTTGNFPIAAGDDAFAYDRNPNSISAQAVSYKLSKKPKKGTPRCLPQGPVGVLDTGALLFDALDAGGDDAAAHEVLDHCGGHPQRTGAYHYHAFSPCMHAGKSDKKHSKRIGWAADGFPIYGPRGKHGKYMKDSKLDACHGHTHKIKVDGKWVRMYHYHLTDQYPYSLGCFRG